MPANGISLDEVQPSWAAKQTEHKLTEHLEAIKANDQSERSKGSDQSKGKIKGRIWKEILKDIKEHEGIRIEIDGESSVKILHTLNDCSGTIARRTRSGNLRWRYRKVFQKEVQMPERGELAERKVMVAWRFFRWFYTAKFAAFLVSGVYLPRSGSFGGLSE